VSIPSFSHGFRGSVDPTWGVFALQRLARSRSSEAAADMVGVLEQVLGRAEGRAGDAR
jgi:hypothetical protein